MAMGTTKQAAFQRFSKGTASPISRSRIRTASKINPSKRSPRRVWGDLPVRVAGCQAGVKAGDLPGGEVLGAVAQQPADLVERVVLVPAVSDGALLHRRRTSSRTWVPSRTTWKASRTSTASGSSSRMALAYPRNGSNAACSTPATNSAGRSLSQAA